MTSEMSLWEALLLGALEGLTEFLPVSSTGHLTIAEKLLGYSIDDPGVTAFTAIIQSGAVGAAVVYLRRDIARMLVALARAVGNPDARASADYRLAVAVIVGSLPIIVVGLAFQDAIETTLRSLWFVGSALILFSAVLWYADRAAPQTRGEASVTARDTLLIGLAQCLALIPGLSRSGATISAGLLLGIDRVTVTRLSFMLAIPALVGATVLQAATEYERIDAGVGWPATIVATLTSFVVGYAAVAWLVRYVAGHSFRPFVVYRVVIGTAVLVLVATGTVSAT
jgi:undecaprenyl-diphosphatase